MTEHLYDLLAVNPTLRPADLLRLTGCSEGLASRAPRAYFAAHPQQQAHPTEKPRPTVAHKAPRPPLSQEVHRRLEEAQGRLIEQGLPVTYEWLAREAHIGYHAIATFFCKSNESPARGKSSRPAYSNAQPFCKGRGRRDW